MNFFTNNKAMHIGMNTRTEFSTQFVYNMHSIWFHTGHTSYMHRGYYKRVDLVKGSIRPLGITLVN
jgi:hypothetical protein